MGFADELRGTKSNEKEYIQAFADLFYNCIKKDCIKAAERGKNFNSVASVDIQDIRRKNPDIVHPRFSEEALDYVSTYGDRLMKVQDCLEPKLRKEGFKKVTFEMQDFFGGKCLVVELYW